jgi:hypothetical protein
MLKPKLSVFSLTQLMITVAAVMFGVYGLINAGDAPANKPAVVSVEEFAPQPRPDTRPLEYTPEHPVIVHGPAAEIPSTPALYSPDDSGTGVIGGSVTFTDGRPVAGMKVTAVNTTINQQAPVLDPHDVAATHQAYDRYFRELERNTRVAVTDDRGQYSFDDLSHAHTYNVTANHAEVGTSRQVGKPGSTLNFEFEVPVIISGVLEADGSLPARYRVYTAVDYGRGRFQAVHNAEFTGREFRIRARPGRVQVTVLAHGWMQQEVPVLEVKDTAAQVTVKLVRGAVLSGTVRSTDNLPVAGATVYLAGEDDKNPGPFPAEGRRSGAKELETLRELEELALKIERVSQNEEAFSRRRISAWRHSAVTDADGNYRIENINPGSYTVTAMLGNFSEARELTLKGGENEADFVLDTGCSVSIVVTSDGLETVQATAAWFRTDEGTHVAAVPGKSTAHELVYHGLPEGSYTMYVQVKGHAQITEEVTVYRGSNRFAVVLPAPCTLTGRVYTPSGTIPRNLYIRVSPKGDVYDGRRRRGPVKAGGQYVLVDKDGHYKAESLVPGEYTVSVEFNANDTLASQEITLVAGANVRDFTLDERCSLSVTLQLAPEVEQTKGISVSATGGPSGRVNRFAQADGAGTFELEYLPEGEYVVYAYAKDGSHATARVTLQRGVNSVTLNIGPPNCVRISQVVEGFQGAEAGLQVGDLVIEYNGKAIANMTELVQAVQATKEEDSVSMVVVRDGRTLSFRLSGGRIGINGDNHRR